MSYPLCYTEHMKKMKNYYIELQATGFKYTDRFSGFDSACAHFSTDAKPTTKPFIEVMMKAIKEIGEQQVSHGWVDYAIGKLYIQDGWRDADVMSPEWEYHKGRSFPTYKEV